MSAPALGQRNLVSCVVPVFNGERFVADAVESILAQTHRPLEIVISDDGSEDGTRRAAEEIASSRPEVRVITQPNGGTSAARNHGAAEARGEFLAFLDVDDLWQPEKLAVQLEVLRGPDADVSVTWMQNVWLDEVAAEAERYRDSALSRPMVGYLTQTMMVRRELFERIGPFRRDLQHSGDTEWMARAKSAGARIHVTERVLVHRRLHRENMSRSARAKADEYLDLARALAAQRKKRPD